MRGLTISSSLVVSLAGLLSVGVATAQGPLPLSADLERAYAKTHALLEKSARNGEGLSPDTGFAPLGQGTLQSALEGQRYRARAYHFDGYADFHKDGTLYLRSKDLVVPGRWQVGDAGLCIVMRNVDFCGPLYSNGPVLVTSNKGRVSPLQLILLNPEPLAGE